MEFTIHISEGKFQNTKKLSEYLKGLNGRYLVKVTNVSKRSIPQNSYIHAVLIPEFRKALYEAGHAEIKTDEIAKAVMKQLFLKTTVDGLEIVKGTSELTKLEMNVLIEDVIRFCAESLSYEIPYPNEQISMKIDEPVITTDRGADANAFAERTSLTERYHREKR
jgi:hypothetical protein